MYHASIALRPSYWHTFLGNLKLRFSLCEIHTEIRLDSEFQIISTRFSYLTNGNCHFWSKRLPFCFHSLNSFWFPGFPLSAQLTVLHFLCFRLLWASIILLSPSLLCFQCSMLYLLMQCYSDSHNDVSLNNCIVQNLRKFFSTNRLQFLMKTIHIFASFILCCVFLYLLDLAWKRRIVLLVP